jgi:hypothetical protein
VKINGVVLIVVLCLFACNFQENADQKFADQHFKTAISLIELHKARIGNYPKTLSELQFTGDWDLIALQSVKYKKVDKGYRLSVIRGWIGQPQLHYPKEFWQGLGILNIDELMQITPKPS